MSPLTTQPSSYASAVTRNLQQQPKDETTQLKQQMEELTVINAMHNRDRISQDHEHWDCPAAQPSQDPQRE
jgi:hypothetical protein